ncbi:95d95aeb-11f1-4b80-b453-7b6df90e5612 [Sclerotinia trifoliorum]|uniref:95d95aeb-11f1-4b80-b453-7b6df90e5612 n=1 Tax=Sclerotinia trifoliorum TaxID=28548 RepID=A0A8H2VW27_9HELO|nr:95d95aeb-11f1-4b80-b453-7b6df90e5612 [Sclerotinia trifoliorum]
MNPHEKNIQPVKETSPDLDQPSTPDMLGPIIKVPSDLSTETPSKLSVPICVIAIGTVDNKGVCESEPLLNLLEAPILRVLDGTACKLVLISKDSETSEVVDEMAVVPKPSEVKAEQSIIYAQQLLDLVVIDLTESNGEESALPMTLREMPKDQNLLSFKSSTTLSSKKRKHSKLSYSIPTSESQDNVSPTDRRTRRKTSLRKHLSDENVFLSSSIKDIEELLEEDRQEMALVEKTRVRLIALKNKFLAWSAHDQRVTEEWEEVSNWY